MTALLKGKYRLGFWAAMIFIATGVTCNRTSPDYRNELSTMNSDRISINGRTFEVWLAVSAQQQERGLMQVTEEELAPPTDADARGMLFVFPDERQRSFWMYNTITPLDIAYISSDGRIVQTWTMAPLETTSYPSGEPARYALEVRAGLFEQYGIQVGDTVDFPDSILKLTP